MQVLTGNIRAAVSIMAKPWAEGHVARIVSFRVPSTEHIELK